MKTKTSTTLALIIAMTFLLSLTVTTPTVLAQPPGEQWYFKPSYVHYAPSGVPDFDQRQGGTYLWQDQFGAWSHCGPVAVANSLWWLDSEFEPNQMPPPQLVDGFPLVRAYGAWDDHSPQNLPWLVEHLAYLMDCDGKRTHMAHSGTNVHDMEAGLNHYLSWAGVNPIGDVNGDGVVNGTDVNVVNAAMGSVPGMFNWNMAADISPASMTYPPLADNVIDVNDLNLVTSNIGAMGLFYEHTIQMPTFEYVEHEVERCQDVVLLLGFWYLYPGGWYRENGHYVTVAGVDSPDFKIAISDPFLDAFETGLIMHGRIPIPHQHMPPEPPFITHNDAAFVSQDIYNMLLLPPMPPCPGGTWALADYPGLPQGMFAVVEYAVITSPYVHDVAVTKIETCKDTGLPMPVISQKYTTHVNVTVLNEGDLAETFEVSALANSTKIGSTTVVGLLPGAVTTVSILWNTTGYQRCNYTLSATAATLFGETHIADNTLNDGLIKVSVTGDTNADNKCNMRDIGDCCNAYGSAPGDQRWNTNANINDENHKVDMRDIGITCNNYGNQEP